MARGRASGRPAARSGPMRRRLPLLAVAAALVLMAACAPTEPAPAPPAATPAGLPATVTDRLDAAVAETMTSAKIPGALVGFWSPEGSYVKAYGVADRATGRAMEPGMFMRIGSETKTFTVTAVLQLVDHGLVELDDPIGKYIPGVPNGDTVTIRQLGEMRSGIPSYTRSPEFFAALTGDPQRQFTPEQLLGYAYAEPVVFPPGTGFDYSNTNTVLLGLLVEKLSGQELDDYFRERIFVPTSMTETTFPNDATYPDPHPEGYTVQTADGKEALATNWNPSWGWAAGAAISDLDDLDKWATALADGTLVKPETQAQRFASVPAGADGYGLGIFRVAGWTGHDGSLPGYQSLTVRLPERDTTLVILLNTDIDAPVENGKATAAPRDLLATAITTVLTPQNVYARPPTPVSPPR